MTGSRDSLMTIKRVSESSRRSWKLMGKRSSRRTLSHSRTRNSSSKTFSIFHMIRRKESSERWLMLLTMPLTSAFAPRLLMTMRSWDIRNFHNLKLPLFWEQMSMLPLIDGCRSMMMKCMQKEYISQSETSTPSLKTSSIPRLKLKMPSMESRLRVSPLGLIRLLLNTREGDPSIDAMSTVSKLRSPLIPWLILKAASSAFLSRNHFKIPKKLCKNFWLETARLLTTAKFPTRKLLHTWLISRVFREATQTSILAMIWRKLQIL